VLIYPGNTIREHRAVKRDLQTVYGSLLPFQQNQQPSPPALLLCPLHSGRGDRRMRRGARALEPTCRKVHGQMQHNLRPDWRMGKSLWDPPFCTGPHTCAGARGRLLQFSHWSTQLSPGDSQYGNLPLQRNCGRGAYVPDFLTWDDGWPERERQGYRPSALACLSLLTSQRGTYLIEFDTVPDCRRRARMQFSARWCIFRFGQGINAVVRIRLILRVRLGHPPGTPSHSRFLPRLRRSGFRPTSLFCGHLELCPWILPPAAAALRARV